MFSFQTESGFVLKRTSKCLLGWWPWGRKNSLMFDSSQNCCAKQRDAMCAIFLALFLQRALSSKSFTFSWSHRFVVVFPFISKYHVCFSFFINPFRQNIFVVFMCLFVQSFICLLPFPFLIFVLSFKHISLTSPFSNPSCFHFWLFGFFCCWCFESFCFLHLCFFFWCFSFNCLVSVVLFSDYDK